MPEKDDRIYLRWLFQYLLPLILLYMALDRGGTGVYAKELMTIPLWGLALMLLCGSRKVSTPPGWLSLIWIAFWIWGIITVIASWSPDGTATWALQFGGFLALGFVVFALAEEPLWNFFRMLFLGATVIIIIGYCFLIGARTGIFVGRHDMMLHFISTFYWKNPAAGYLMLLMPLSFALSFADPAKGWRIFYFCIAFLSAGALLLTRSRGAWLAFAIAVPIGFIFALGFMKRIWRRAIALVVLAIAISFIAMPPSWVMERVVQVSEIAKKEAEEPIQERRMMLDMGWRVLRDNPIFGVGMGAFRIAYPKYLKSTHYLSSHLHNQYLQFAAEGGFPAAILFAASVFATIFGILWRARKRKDIVIMGLGIGALAYAFHIGLDFDWTFWGTSLPFMVLLAVGARTAWNEKAGHMQKKWKIVPAIVIAICFLMTISFSIAGSYFDQYEGEIGMNRQQASLSRCTTLNPLSARYWYERAQTYAVSKENEKALWALEKAYGLEPHNALFPYAYGFMLWDTDRNRAVEYLKKAVAATPYIMPNLQLDFAHKARDAGMTDVAKEALEGIMKNFSTNPNTRYTERTVGYRYIVARAIGDLADMALVAGDFPKADSLFRIAQSLGCPRFQDRLARTWGLDIISPEQTIAEILDAVNVGDTLRSWQYFADSTRARLKSGSEIYLIRVFNVKQNMISEEASVDVLIASVSGEHISWTMGFFNLVLQDGHWKVQMGF